MICSTISGEITWNVLPPQTAHTTGAASTAETPHFRQIEIALSLACSSTIDSARLGRRLGALRHVAVHRLVEEVAGDHALWPFSTARRKIAVRAIP